MAIYVRVFLQESTCHASRLLLYHSLLEFDCLSYGAGPIVNWWSGSIPLPMMCTEYCHVSSANKKELSTEPDTVGSAYKASIPLTTCPGGSSFAGLSHTFQARAWVELPGGAGSSPVLSSRPRQVPDRIPDSGRSSRLHDLGYHGRSSLSQYVFVYEVVVGVVFVGSLQAHQSDANQLPLTY